MVWDADCGLKDPDELTSELAEAVEEHEAARRRELRRRRRVRSTRLFPAEPSEPPRKLGWRDVFKLAYAVFLWWLAIRVVQDLWYWLLGT